MTSKVSGAAQAAVYHQGLLRGVADQVFQKLCKEGADFYGMSFPEFTGKQVAVVHVCPVDGDTRDPLQATIIQLEESPAAYGPALRHALVSYVLEQHVRLSAHVCADKRLGDSVTARHLTSAESRAPSRLKFGGAVAVPLGGTECVVATAGFSRRPELSYASEQIAEAFSLLVALAYGRAADDSLAAERAEAVAAFTENRFFIYLRDVVLG